MHAVVAFQLGRTEIINLAENAVNMIFNEAEKSRLSETFKLFRMDVRKGKVDFGTSSISIT